MNRRERRKLKKQINIFSDVVNIIKQYFPQLIEKLENLTDTRHQSYVEYKMSVNSNKTFRSIMWHKKYERNNRKI